MFESMLRSQLLSLFLFWEDNVVVGVVFYSVPLSFYVTISMQS